MRYLRGRSYGAVTLALAAWGVNRSKTNIYRAGQTAAAVPDRCQQRVFGGRKAAALEADLTAVGCQGQWVPWDIAMAEVTGGC